MQGVHVVVKEGKTLCYLHKRSVEKYVEHFYSKVLNLLDVYLATSYFYSQSKNTVSFWKLRSAWKEESEVSKWLISSLHPVSNLFFKNINIVLGKERCQESTLYGFSVQQSPTNHVQNHATHFSWLWGSHHGKEVSERSHYIFVQTLEDLYHHSNGKLS